MRGAYERGCRRLKALGARAGTLPPPLLTGSDLLAMGIAEGPGLGQVLKALETAQLNEEIRTRQDAIAFVKSHQTD